MYVVPKNSIKSTKSMVEDSDKSKTGSVKVDVLLDQAVLLQLSSNVRDGNEPSKWVNKIREECLHSSLYFFTHLLGEARDEVAVGYEYVRLIALCIAFTGI